MSEQKREELRGWKVDAGPMEKRGGGRLGGGEPSHPVVKHKKKEERARTVTARSCRPARCAATA